MNELSLWQDCLLALQDRLSGVSDHTDQNPNFWLKPLQVEYVGDELMVLYASNFFIEAHINSVFLGDITSICRELTQNPNFTVEVRVGSKPEPVTVTPAENAKSNVAPAVENEKTAIPFQSNLDPYYLFENFVEGKSNEWAKAAGQKIAMNPGDKRHNPLFIYGGTALGKSHLLHAIGNSIMARHPQARVMYLHAERFMHFFVTALNDKEKQKKILEFKEFYRNLDALLIDDIQFFAGKDAMQEVFFHIFNALMESNHQIVLVSNEYPKEIDKIEDRLKSRFGWGLSIPIEPPDLETRVGILLQKAEERKFHLPHDVATFIGQRLRTNVRELEGALNILQANAEFTGRAITIDYVRDVLRHMIAVQDKLVTIENIQKIVAEYFHVKVQDLKSKSKKRTITRPRQMAMALAKELTNRSLPEIGNEFGGRDHTTVLHACKKVAELRQKDTGFQEDWLNLMRTLSV